MKGVAAALLAVVAMGAPPASASGHAAGVQVVVNGVEVPLPAPALIRDGQVLAPFTGLWDPLGAVAAYYEADRTVVVTNRLQTTIRLRMGEAQATVNGEARPLPTAPVLVDGVPYIPVQAVAQLLGAWVAFDDAARILHVSSQITALTPQVKDGIVEVVVDATGPVQVDSTVLTNPDRLVVDLQNAALRVAQREYPAGAAGVIRIRVGQFQIKPYITRVVFDLTDPVDLQVTASPTTYAVTLRVTPKTSARADAPPQQGPARILGVAFEPSGQAGRVVVQTTGPVQYRVREFVYPDRLAVDIADTVFVPVRQEIAVHGPAVAVVRAAQFTARPPVTRVVVTLKRKLNYLIAQSGGSLVIDLDASVARAHVVALDAGHGGKDPGALGPTGLREADVVLDIARRVRDLLVADGIRVLMIRDADVFVDLSERTRLAREGGATVFISIHANASPRAAVDGTETYYLTPQSLALAQMIQEELAAALDLPSRGVKTAGFVVLRDSGVPSVLVETAFISHPDGEARLRDDDFRQRIAAAVHRGIVRFLAIYPVPQGAP
ncbi:MAG: N-acetylmuramoyl-L-alanine amidase family protein [Armatimonadota bacterium]|nr:N-acetylmuramoyl-L-alanine amidase family protein [Armatimonadota bacterium]MDR7404209.1 N-acetylmuramoyl-L-alanine amidase family protein [Armatimonadota bacterium]